MLTSSDLHELATALSLAQGELADAGKNAVNTFFKSPGSPQGSKYADLAEVLQTIRPIASKHGLSFVQGVAYTDGLARVVTRLMHKTGQFLQEELDIPLTKKDAQGLGAALTYGRRYAVAAMFGIAQDDDDGNTASEAPSKNRAKTPQTEVQPPSKTQVLTDVSRALIAEFDKLGSDKVGDPERMKELTQEFASLTAVEQTQVRQAGSDARKRMGL